MRTSEQLRAAKALIERPETWIQYSFANGKGGYCASGAIGHTLYGPGFLRLPHNHQTSTAYLALVKAMNVEANGVSGYNDSHTHAEVLAAFDKAITEREAAND